jgi:hypothetical protein
VSVFFGHIARTNCNDWRDEEQMGLLVVSKEKEELEMRIESGYICLELVVRVTVSKASISPQVLMSLRLSSSPPSTFTAASLATAIANSQTHRVRPIATWYSPVHAIPCLLDPCPPSANYC